MLKSLVANLGTRNHRSPTILDAVMIGVTGSGLIQELTGRRLCPVPGRTFLCQ